MVKINENANNPYDAMEDEDMPQVGLKRKAVITMRAINRLKKIRRSKNEELAQDSTFIPTLYGPQQSSENEGGGLGGMGL